MMKQWIRFALLLLKDNKGQFMGGAPEGSSDASSDGGQPEGGNVDPVNADSGSVDATTSKDVSGGQFVQHANNFLDSLEEDIRESASLKAFVKSDGSYSFNDLAKSYVHQSKLIGKDKVVVPGDTATEDDWNVVWDKLGRPDVDGYKKSDIFGEEAQVSDEFFKEYAEIAHKNGVLPRQAEALSKYFYEQVVADQQHVVEQKQQKLDQSVSALKEEWGDAYNSKLVGAESALKHFASDEQIQALKDAGVLDSVELTKVFAKIQESLSSEDDFPEGEKKSFNMTPDDVNKAIEDMYKDPAFTNKYHPNNKVAKERFMKLMNMKSAINAQQ